MSGADMPSRDPRLVIRHLRNHPLAGIAYYIVAMLCFSGMNALIRLTATEASSLQIVFLRNLFSLAIMLPIAYLFSRRSDTPRTTRLSLHFWRAAIGLFAMETWFYALSLMPVNQATAIGFTSPLFATVFAVALLGESIGPWRIAALAAGFGGTLIILHPGAGSFSSASLIALFAASMMSIASIVVKRLTATEPAWRIVLYMAGFMSLLSAPLGLYAWRAVANTIYMQTLGIAFCSTMAQLAMVGAFARASIVLLMPFDFTKLVFTAAIAYFVLGETLDARTLLGAAVIVGSSAIIAWREARHKEEAATPGEVF